MPRISTQSTDVVSNVELAALFLSASVQLARFGLSHPTTRESLEATGVSRSRAYEVKERLDALLPTLTAPSGRPPKPAEEPCSRDLATEVLSYVLDHPGCVSGGGQRREYSDGFTFFVMELMERHSDISIDVLAQIILVPAGTLKEWRRRAALPEPPEESAGEDPAEQEEAKRPRLQDAEENESIDGSERSGEDNVRDNDREGSPATSKRRGLYVETVLAEWKTWDGRFSPFCEHLRKHCGVPLGRTLVAEILEADGVRLPRRRPGRSPDEDAIRDAFVTFFPHAQWVGDGTQIPVLVNDELFVFNLELDVDAYSGAFVGAHVSGAENSQAVVQTFLDAIEQTGVQPIALLLDNKPSNHIHVVDEILGETLRIRATAFRPENKAHCEGGFGLLKPNLEGLTLEGDTPQGIATSFLRALVIAASRAFNNRPRKDRGGRTRVDLLGDKPTAEEVEHARCTLAERLRKQELARKTLAARQDPVVRSTIEAAYVRLDLDDPQGHLLTATARYPLDAVVEGIAIFEAKRRADTLPEDVDARYMLGIVRNVSHEHETWELARVLWDERLAARDRIAVMLENKRCLMERYASSNERCIIKYVDEAMLAQGRIERFFWLGAAADMINDRPTGTHLQLFRLAARRIAATHSVSPEIRNLSQRFLVARILPLQ
jgi:transposase InsO family protein